MVAEGSIFIDIGVVVGDMLRLQAVMFLIFVGRMLEVLSVIVHPIMSPSTNRLSKTMDT